MNGANYGFCLLGFADEDSGCEDAPIMAKPEGLAYLEATAKTETKYGDSSLRSE
jgi:hypothetical protein